LIFLGLPGAIALPLFQYVPLLGNAIAFQDYQPYLGFTESEWVGLTNFSFLWDGNPDFRNALINTLILTVIQTVLVFPVPHHRADLPYGYENRRGLCGLVRLDLREPVETLRWWVTSSTDRRGVSAPTASQVG
jgi:hypothetical protein